MKAPPFLAIAGVVAGTLFAAGLLMSAVYVPSAIAFGVTLMPPNPVSPFRKVKLERYVPGGGSR